MFGQLCALLRYVVLARIIGPEQLGLAAFLMLTAQFLENVSDTGSDRFIVQDREGDSARLLSVVHSAMTLRGVLIAGALVLFAGPVAKLYGTPQIGTSIMWLAITPFIAGFVHYGIRQAQRARDFRPESATIIAGESAALLGTAAAAYIVRDHTAVIYGLAMRAIAMVVASHVTARRAYRWGYAKDEAVRFGAFAAPLFLNGFLLFVGSQGDRLLIGSTVGPTALGYYSAILLLILSPMAAMSRFMMTLHLPTLSARRDEQPAFDQASNRLGGRAIVLAAVAAAVFTLVGPGMTWLFYGKDYLQPVLVFALLAALQALRFVRVWPNTIAVAVGRSSVVTVNNLARLVALPAALLAAMAEWGLEGIVAAYIAGEVIALLAALAQLARRRAINVRRELKRTAMFCVFLVTICGWGLAIQAGVMWTFPVLAFMTVATAAEMATRERPVLLEAFEMARRRLGRRR